MINGDLPLPDSTFKASSARSASDLPKFARLNNNANENSEGSWSPAVNNEAEYLQVTFPEPEPLFGIIIKGSPVFDHYVTLFKVTFLWNCFFFGEF